MKNREMERKIEIISTSLNNAKLECKKCKENETKIEEIRNEVRKEIVKANKTINQSLDDCVDFITQENKEAEAAIGHMVESFLDAKNSDSVVKCSCDMTYIRHKDKFVHDVNRENTFRVEEGRWWHPEMCIICKIKEYLGDEDTYSLFKVHNVRGCLWIEFEEKSCACKFDNYMKQITIDNIIKVKSIPKTLKDLISEIEAEEKWCGHSNPL